jgi:hypothetical protein
MRILITVLACLAASCSNPTANHWLIGEWEFDSDYTKKKQAEKPPDKDLAGGLKSAVAEQLNEKMQGAKLQFTPQEFTMTTKDGNGKAFPYTLASPTDANAAAVKTSDGEVNTFHREGERIWMTSTGNVNEPFYFKRKK